MIRDIDDLAGMLPTEILAVIAAAEARATQAERERDALSDERAHWLSSYMGMVRVAEQAGLKQDALTAELAASEASRAELVAAADALADWVGWWLSARREEEASKFSEMRKRLDAYRAARAALSRQPAGGVGEATARSICPTCEGAGTVVERGSPT